MVSEEELSCEDDVWSFDNIMLHVKKEQWEIDFYSGKETFIQWG